MLQSRDQKLLPCPPRPLMVDRRWKTTVEVAPNCPRCNSSNTKFCYYNNYSLTQPRYFCKGCRRYWTKGGSLRNVPVGGGCRKNRRGKSLSRLVPNNNSDRVAINSNLHARSSPVARARGGDDGSSSSSSSADASTIDLAVVYAKFLNHQPAADDAAPAGVQTEFDGGAAASLELSSSNGSGHRHSPVQFSDADPSINMECRCSFDGHGLHKLYDPDPQIFSDAINTSHDIPALPQYESLVNYGGGGGGDCTLQSIINNAPSTTDIDDTGGGCFGVEDTLWSSCCLMEPNLAAPHHDHHHPQGLESMIQLNPHDDMPLQPSFLNGNSWSTSFDYLSSSCTDAFTRP